jgi:hypothetical protein
MIREGNNTLHYMLRLLESAVAVRIAHEKKMWMMKNSAQQGYAVPPGVQSTGTHG